MTDKFIRGSGGPPPSPPTPYRAPDTLNSRQFATILDLLSEGEIEGFATPSRKNIAFGNANYLKAALADVFLNDTSVLNIDTSLGNTAFVDKLNNLSASDYNYQNIALDTRLGTSNQPKISGIVGSDSLSSGFSPALCTVANGGVSQDISTGKDAVKVTVMFPQLQQAKDNGDLLGASVELSIRLQINNQTSGGPSDTPTHEVKINDTITGRTADPYSKEYRIELPDTYSQANIKIVRVTADSTSDQLKDEFRVTVIQEIIDDGNTYPNSAYTSLRIDSENFSSIPKRAFRIRGIKVRIPAANGGLTPTVDPETGRIIYPDNYVFAGTFGAAQWTSCPSCILLDLLTNERYGFGTFLDPDGTFTSSGQSTLLNLYSFVTASKYANALVNDGFNSQEARFSCNVNIQSTREAYDLIKDLAAVMRCIPTWSQGSISLVQDAPSDPVYLFNLANVTQDGFSYTGASLKQRHSVVSVSYFNMDSRELDFEVYGDGNTTAEVTRRQKFGVVYKQVKSFGCTSRGQAQRLARAIVFSEEQESEVVSFETSIDAGSIVRPGSVILINDPVRQGDRRSGRIKAATNSAGNVSITVDDIKDLSSFGGTNQKVSVILPNGSVESGSVIGLPDDSSSVISVNNITRVVNGTTTTGNATFTTTPNVNSIWLLESDSTGEAPQTFRVISVEEQDGINYAITALSYRSEKYDNIESTDFPTLPARSISRLNIPKPAPVIHTPIREEIAVINNIAVNKILLSWTPVTGVTQYQVQYRYEKSNWVTEVVFRPDLEIMNTEAGIYEFKVFSYNATLQLSTVPATAELDATGKKDPPEDVANLTAEPVSNNTIRLRWDKSIAPDVLHGGRVYIRHSNKTDGTGTFANSVDLIEAVAGNSTEAVVPSLEGEYILKFRDDGGRFSLGETSVIMDLPDLIDAQGIFTDREDTGSSPFSGNKTNTTLASGALKLTDPSVVRQGNYTQSGINITVSIGNHGISVGETLNFRFTAGLAKSGLYTVVSTPTPSTLVIQSDTSIGTGGTVSVDRGLRGQYDFATILDLGGVFSVNLKRHFQSIGFFVGTNIEDLIPNTSPEFGGPPDGGFDNYAVDGNFDGPTAQKTNAQILVATTSAAPTSGSGNYQSSDFNGKPFNIFANGVFKGRGFKFKLKLKTDDAAQNISVEQAGYSASFDSRFEQSPSPIRSVVNPGVDNTPAAKTITFGSPFFTGTSSTDGGLNAYLPNVGITIQNAGAGQYFELTNISGTGFTCAIKDSGGNLIDKEFSYQAVGYGKGV